MDFETVEILVATLTRALEETHHVALIEAKNQDDGTPDDVILVSHKDDGEPCLAIRPVY